MTGSPTPKYRIIEFPEVEGRGTMTIFGNISFPIKNVFTMQGMEKGDVRGEHAHRDSMQVLVPLSGGCTVEIDDGKNAWREELRPTKGIEMYPLMWHKIYDFLPHTILLCISSREYDEKDYIRSYDDFLASQGHTA